MVLSEDLRAPKIKVITRQVELGGSGRPKKKVEIPGSDLMKHFGIGNNNNNIEKSETAVNSTAQLSNDEKIETV